MAVTRLGGWTLLASTTGTTKKTFTLGDYNEVCVVARYPASGSRSYLGTAVVPAALLDANEQELYLGGGRNATGAGGRKAVCKLTKTYVTPVEVVVDGTSYTSTACQWYVYAR